MPPAFDPTPLLKTLASLTRADEAECLTGLFEAARLSPLLQTKASTRARLWVEDIRRTHRPSASATDLLSRFGLSSQEGLALMCLAEALLRIPDRATADALIRDKLGENDWNEALGEGAPWVLNATGWALAVAGKVIHLDDGIRGNPGAALGKLVSRLGQPIVREAIRAAMEWLADQFVMGQSIDRALTRVRLQADVGVRYSFDMLGEGARTGDDADRYFQEYANAIEAVGQFQTKGRYKRVSGISVKLSALHPRYEMAQNERVMRELVPRLLTLCELAAKLDVPVTIDAEEVDRLHLSLEVGAKLLTDAKLGDWQGLGFAVQAYQKRAPAVIDFIAELARAHKRRLGIRLVKGAYWDSEIKRAQERGFGDFPVFTRKAATDVSYLACAHRLLTFDHIDPVFGTHNALTASQILQLASDASRIEFQRLHGMGEELYRLLHKEGYNTCVYAPVGAHNVLLGYLVRRILENGANSSFVHRLFDRSVPVEELIKDPVQELQALPQMRHPLIRRAPDIYQPERRNSEGLDLSDPFVTGPLLEEIEKFRKLHSVDADSQQRSSPLEGEVRWGGLSTSTKDSARGENPTPDPALKGRGTHVESSGSKTTTVLDEAFGAAQRSFAAWSQEPVEKRARCLERLGDLIEENRAELMALLIHEGGKTIPDALGEVREAADYCRYYAARARVDFAVYDLQGPTGERNQIRLCGRGVFACISPWNFPLAIFLGQIVAALVAGNAVIAKPAPQTPRIALRVKQLVYAAGIPGNVFHVVPGGPEIGAALVKMTGIAGVAFTGSYATARSINIALAGKPGPIVPFIAETGGQNALIVDSSALPEQVVDDVITSAFRSAGQRCSALRVLYLPDATADRILDMLKGAMRELSIGDPGLLATDVGPVIDRTAQRKLLEHVERLRTQAREICTVEFDLPPNRHPDESRDPAASDSERIIQTARGRAPLDSGLRRNDGWFFVEPQAWEIPSIGWLEGEVFGPILHVIRMKDDDIARVIAEINATGFGLTGGLHSRIESAAKQMERDLRVGNLYINRSLIGAVVGAQPFGGEGISGTGPKAGGPHYLPRFAVERVMSNNLTAAGGNASLLIATSR